MTSRGTHLRSVLVDSGGWLALADERDDNHPAALAVQRRIAAERLRLYVTNFLIDEAYTLIRARLNHRLAVRFLDDVYASSINRIRVTPDDEIRAEAVLRRYNDKRFSYTDATSFVVMERVGIDTVFSFDVNFGQYGLQMLTP